MSTFYLVNTTQFQNVKYLPGDLIDSTIVDLSVFPASALLWPSADTLVAAAALSAQTKHTQQGMNEADMQSIMLAAVDASVKATNDAQGVSLSALAALTPSKATVTILASTLQALGVGVKNTTANLVPALPANARIMGIELVRPTAFVPSAGTLVADVGDIAGTNLELTNAQDITGTGGTFPKPGTAGSAASLGNSAMAGKTLGLKIVGSADLNGITNAGTDVITANVFYFIQA